MIAAKVNVSAFVKADESCVYLFYAMDGNIYRMNNMILGSFLSGNLITEDDLGRVIKEPICDRQWTVGKDFLVMDDSGSVDISSDVCAYLDLSQHLHILNFDIIRKYVFDTFGCGYMTISAWAEREKCSVSTAKVLCQTGRIPKAVKLGKMWLIPTESSFPERGDRKSSDVTLIYVPICALTGDAIRFLNEYDKRFTFPFKVECNDGNYQLHLLDDSIRAWFTCFLKHHIGDAVFMPPSIADVIRAVVNSRNDNIVIEFCESTPHSILSVSWQDMKGKIYASNASEPEYDCMNYEFVMSDVLSILAEINELDSLDRTTDIVSIARKHMNDYNRKCLDFQQDLFSTADI